MVGHVIHHCPLSKRYTYRLNKKQKYRNVQEKELYLCIISQKTSHDSESGILTYHLLFITDPWANLKHVQSYSLTNPGLIDYKDI